MKCQDCPAPGLPGTCPGERSTAACRLPGIDGRYAAVFRAAAGGEPYVQQPTYTIEPQPPGPDPADWVPSGDAPPPPAHPSTAESLAVLRKIRECPDRTPCTTCALGKATCARGRGNGGTVYPDDCRICPVVTGTSE